MRVTRGGSGGAEVEAGEVAERWEDEADREKKDELILRMVELTDAAALCAAVVVGLVPRMIPELGNQRSRLHPQRLHLSEGKSPPPLLECSGSITSDPSTIAVATLRRERNPSPGARSSRRAGSESSSTQRFKNACERCVERSKCGARSWSGVS